MFIFEPVRAFNYLRGLIPVAFLPRHKCGNLLIIFNNLDYPSKAQEKASPSVYSSPPFIFQDVRLVLNLSRGQYAGARGLARGSVA